MTYAMTGCHGLLDVSDPTLTRDKDIANASGANARRLDVVNTVNDVVSATMVDVARLTDEWIQDAPATASLDFLDRRDSDGFENAIGTSDLHLGNLDQIYFRTSIAIPAVRAYTPDSLKGDFLAQLYALRGYAILQAAEDLCPGFPLNDVGANNESLFGGPLTTDSAIALASTQLDSAVKYVHDSVQIAALARVVKGRALLDQGRYAEAAAVVAPVATQDVYQTDGTTNTLWARMRPGVWSRNGINFAVGDREGGNGLPFVSAHDPRIPLVLGGARATQRSDTLYKTTKYTSSNSPVTLASGIEARLIEAEARIQAADTSWFGILNTLRTTAIVPAMSEITMMPTTQADQIDLLYSERGFWLYATGRRLGDLRRLIRNYGRDPEMVFPTGAYPLGGTYGSATAIPFIFASQRQSNPNILSGCTLR